MPAWESSSTNSVISSSSSIPINTSCVAKNVINSNQGDCSMVNHPRLLTKLRKALLRISFLKRCRNLKRPPQSLRLKHPQSVAMKTFIKAASEAETNILNSEISDKQIEINSSKKDISNSCPSLLD